MNHFHDPLKPWTEAGLWPFKSSIVWAQDQGWFGSLFGKDYSWKKSRKSFYEGLTQGTNEFRDEKLAETFRAIGQVMHLIQDASVPSHTRNDLHVFFTYEDWVETLRLEDPVTFTAMITSHQSIDPNLFTLTPEAAAPIPIANLFDTNRYTGDNPEVTFDSKIGLAEYSNANFFSEDSIFKNYPSPNWDQVEEVDIEYFDPTFNTSYYRRYYYRRLDDWSGYRLATVGFLKDYATRYFPDYIELFKASEKPALDADVYYDYASFLLSQASRYSSALLNYFFRGILEVKQTGSRPTGEVEITITNQSSDTLVNGVFELYYDNKSGVRTKIDLGESDVANIPYKGTFVTTFLPPTDFDPEKMLKYMLVYKGELGTEKESVIGQYGPIQTVLPTMVTYDRTENKIFYKFSPPNENFYIDCGEIIPPDAKALMFSVIEYKAGMGALVYQTGSVYKILKFKISREGAPSNLTCSFDGLLYKAANFEYLLDEVNFYLQVPQEMNVPLYPISNYTPDGVIESHTLRSSTYPVMARGLSTWMSDPASQNLQDLHYELVGEIMVLFLVDLKRPFPNSYWHHWSDSYVMLYGVTTRGASWSEPLNIYNYDGVFLAERILGYDIFVRVAGGLYTFEGGGLTQYEEPGYIGEVWEIFNPSGTDLAGYLFGYSNGLLNFLERTYLYYTPTDRRELLAETYFSSDYWGPWAFSRSGGGTLQRAMGRIWRGQNSFISAKSIYLIDDVLYKWKDEIPETAMNPDEYPFGRQDRELLLGRKFKGMNDTPVCEITTAVRYNPHREIFTYKGKVKDQDILTGESIFAGPDENLLRPALRLSDFGLL